MGTHHPRELTDPGLRMRMASISKSITARIACELAVAGLLDLETAVVDLLRWTGAPALMSGVTVRHLLNHTSGLTDHAGYLFDPPRRIEDFIAANAGAIGSGQAPGTWFKYANLNYVLLGVVLETVTGHRFDHMASVLVLEPAGIAGGFNWAGVPPARRTQHLPIYQRHGHSLSQQTEPADSDWSAELLRSDGRGVDLGPYVEGRDTMVFSPHAGIRMNVIEAARLARFLSADTPAGHLQRQESWRYDPDTPNGTPCDGLFQAFGLGLMIYRGDPRLPGPLIGHSGHALGFSGGVWHNESTGRSIAIALTGSADLSDGQQDEAFFAAPELDLMQLV